MGQVFPERGGLEDHFDLTILYHQSTAESNHSAYSNEQKAPLFLAKEKYNLPQGTSVLQCSEQSQRQANRLTELLSHTERGINKRRPAA